MTSRRPRDRFGRPLPAGSPDALRADPARAEGESVRDACLRGIALFDARRFFEAHESFESCWKSSETDEANRPFWKGVTQVAVGCCHAQRGNDRGALALLARARSYLAGYPSPWLGIDTRALAAVALRVEAQVRSHGASDRLAFPSFPATAGALRDPPPVP